MRFLLETASRPPELKMGLGEAVKMSSQWRVEAVTFCMLFWEVIGLAQGGSYGVTVIWGGGGLFT